MDIVIAPDQKLRVKTKPVKKINQGLLTLVKQMIKKTKSFKDPEGVGLASTQIGRDEQLFIAKLEENKFFSVFNPKILSYSKKTKIFFEGCLSIPNYWGEIKRPISVKVTYQDEAGKQIIERLTGTKAWIFQHEYDHLQGKLVIDHVLEQKARLFKVVGKDRAGADVFQEVSL